LDEAKSVDRHSIRLNVHLTPRAGRNALAGWREGVLQARVAAPPADGRANEALIRLVAGALGIAAGRVAIVGGKASRRKVIEIEADGLVLDDVLRKLGWEPTAPA
jgi:uncharacterized protein (TIGR00251 family)